MSTLKLFFVALSLVTLSSPAMAAKSLNESGSATTRDARGQILLAQAKKGNKASAKKKGVRERIMTREARGKFTKDSDQRNIDFDAVDIGGQRKTPMGSLVSQSKADKDYDFVKIRLRWHAEMFQSASSLESGGD